MSYIYILHLPGQEAERHSKSPNGRKANYFCERGMLYAFSKTISILNSEEISRPKTNLTFGRHD